MHSTETAISKQRVVDNDLTLIPELFTQMSNAMHDHFMRSGSGPTLPFVGLQRFRQLCKVVMPCRGRAWKANS